jgi:tRNA 2-thiouridine synthesizing protein B
VLLHTINKSPYSHHAFASCIQFCQKEDAIILIEDAVYGVGHSLFIDLQEYSIYALEADLIARGLKTKYEAQSLIKTISYEVFVDLCIEFPKQKNW